MSIQSDRSSRRLTHDNHDTLSTRHVRAVNFVQALLGCAYGFVTLNRLVDQATHVQCSSAPAQDALIRGIAFDCLKRRARGLTPSEWRRLFDLVDDICRPENANYPSVVAAMRALMRITPPDLALKIREVIDREYAAKPSIKALARSFAVEPADADAAFKRSFGVGVLAYLARRRVEEGLALVRSGVKVDAAARIVGYRGKRHFYRAVLEATGTTPAACRPKRDSGAPRR